MGRTPEEEEVESNHTISMLAADVWVSLVTKEQVYRVFIHLKILRQVVTS